MTCVVSAPQRGFSQRKYTDNTMALHSARKSGRWKSSGILTSQTVRRVRNREQSVIWVVHAVLCSHNRWRNDRVNRLPLRMLEDKKNTSAGPVRKKSGRACKMANPSSQ